MKIIIRLMVFARKYWGWLLLAFLGLLVSTAFSLAVPWVLREAIDNIISQGESNFLILAAIAIIIRVNLPISVALVWISNPITMPPLFYAAYKFGAYIMGQEAIESDYELTIEWFSNQLDSIWEPFLLGCLIFGLVSAIIGFVAIRLLWRLHIIQHLKERRARKQGKKSAV